MPEPPKDHTDAVSAMDRLLKAFREKSARFAHTLKGEEQVAESASQRLDKFFGDLRSDRVESDIEFTRELRAALQSSDGSPGSIDRASVAARFVTQLQTYAGQQRQLAAFEIDRAGQAELMAMDAIRRGDDQEAREMLVRQSRYQDAAKAYEAEAAEFERLAQDLVAASAPAG